MYIIMIVRNGRPILKISYQYNTVLAVCPKVINAILLPHAASEPSTVTAASAGMSEIKP